MRSLKVWLAGGSLLIAAGNAAGAETAPSGSASDAPLGLEEIVVTARHREENLQTVPVSITALSGAQLANQHVDNFADVVSKVPGFVVNPDNITQPNLFMRGIGTDIRTSASNPGVAVFIDDVYLSRNAALLGDLWDLERVEVLEGPQSTLFGKNAVGGLVNFVTRKPSRTPYADAELTVGNYGAVTGRAIASGPLSETLAGSFSFSSQTHDGYETNTLTGGHFDQLNLHTARSHLRFTPSDDLEVLLSVDGTRRRGTGHFMYMSYTTRNQAFEPPSPREGPVSGPVCSNVTGEKFANGFGSGPLNGPLNCASPDGNQDADDFGTSLRIDWKNPLGKLTSLSAYRHSKLFYRGNDAGLPMDFAAITPFVTHNNSIADDFYYQQKVEKVNQYSQELRLASDSSGPFNWIGGLYFLHEKLDRNVMENFLFPDIFWYSGTQYVRGDTLGRSYGAFAEGSYHWDSGLGVTVGARYSRDKKDWDYEHRGYSITGSYGKDANGNPIPTPEGFSANTSGTWGAFTPSVVLDWKRNPDEYFYVKVARGYQSGGFGAEDSAADPSQAIVPFKPEFALNYEAGAKLDLFERHLRINPTVYWTNYTDLQILTLVPGFIATDLLSNAGKARSRGAELQVTAAPVRGLEFYGAYAYLDCKITASTPTTSIEGAPIDINGYACRRSPKNSFNVGTHAEWGAGSLGSVFVQADYTWTGGYFFDTDNNPITAVGTQSRIDGSLGVNSRDGRWQVSVWGKNLADKLLISGRTTVVTPDCRSFKCDAQSTTAFTTYQAPRTYGLTVRWRFTGE